MAFLSFFHSSVDLRNAALHVFSAPLEHIIFKARLLAWFHKFYSGFAWVVVVFIFLATQFVFPKIWNDFFDFHYSHIFYSTKLLPKPWKSRSSHWSSMTNNLQCFFFDYVNQLNQLFKKCFVIIELNKLYGLRNIIWYTICNLIIIFWRLTTTKFRSKT